MSDGKDGKKQETQKMLERKTVKRKKGSIKGRKIVGIKALVEASPRK